MVIMQGGTHTGNEKNGFMLYETFEHEADIGIRGFGATIPEAFEHAAQALYSVMVTMETIEIKEERSVSVSASDIEQLFVGCGNFAANWAVDLRCGFDRFNRANLIAFADRIAYAHIEL